MTKLEVLLAACSYGTLISIREDIDRWMSEIDTVVIERDRESEREMYQSFRDLVQSVIDDREG